MKHEEGEHKKLNELSEKVKLLSTKGYKFLLGRTNFTDNGYEHFLVFAPLINSLVLDNNKKVINWLSTGVSAKKLNHLILILRRP